MRIAKHYIHTPDIVGAFSLGYVTGCALIMALAYYWIYLGR